MSCVVIKECFFRFPGTSSVCNLSKMTKHCNHWRTSRASYVHPKILEIQVLVHTPIGPEVFEVQFQVCNNERVIIKHSFTLGMHVERWLLVIYQALLLVN
uniref:Uncharacterized protein n=1 Tax=Rhipicephalus appendiculatus TaxID=34631 RepID=A0A131YE94_RHIAP